MATLTVDTPRDIELGQHNHIGVIASDIIYEGAAVGDNGSGYARPLVSGDPFLGIATAKSDNSTGSAGDVSVEVVRVGKVKLSVTSCAITDVGRPVYASDDNTFNLSGIGSKVGYVERFVSSGVAIVAISDEPEKVVVVSIPVTLANVADGDLLTSYAPSFNGRVKSIDFAVTTAVTTAAKTTTLNVEVGTTDLTGGVLTLTSANCTPLGAVVADTAITAGAAFKASENISIEASSTTAFVEGAGVLLLTLGQ